MGRGINGEELAWQPSDSQPQVSDLEYEMIRNSKLQMCDWTQGSIVHFLMIRKQSGQTTAPV